MFRRSFAIFAFATVVFAVQARAQSMAEQLEKGIHLQDTAGDPDEAIRTFRQILASSPAQRSIAAEAQYRLALALLQKGDLDGSSAEFQRLAAAYPEQKEFIASLAAHRASRSRSSGSTISLGTLFINRTPSGKNGRYMNRLTRHRVLVHGRMGHLRGLPVVDNGEQVCLTDRVSGSEGFIWMKPEDGVWDRAAQLQYDLQVKPRMRGPDWKARSGSVVTKTIAGAPALSAVADYTEESRKMVEYCVWIRGDRARLFYSMRIPAAEFRCTSPASIS